jgi:hypothetical protein
MHCSPALWGDRTCIAAPRCALWCHTHPVSETTDRSAWLIEIRGYGCLGGTPRETDPVITSRSWRAHARHLPGADRNWHEANALAHHVFTAERGMAGVAITVESTAKNNNRKVTVVLCIPTNSVSPS